MDPNGRDRPWMSPHRVSCMQIPILVNHNSSHAASPYDHYFNHAPFISLFIYISRVVSFLRPVFLGSEVLTVGNIDLPTWVRSTYLTNQVYRAFTTSTMAGVNVATRHVLHVPVKGCLINEDSLPPSAQWGRTKLMGVTASRGSSSSRIRRRAVADELLDIWKHPRLSSSPETRKIIIYLSCQKRKWEAISMNASLTAVRTPYRYLEDRSLTQKTST